MKQLNTYPKEGTCPVCDGAQVEMGSAVIDEAGLHYHCTCEECKAVWDECYDLIFAGHWNIYTGDDEEWDECYDLIFAGHWNIYTGDDEECEDLPT